MNRDAIIATVIGFGIGLLITGIFLVGPNFAQYLPKFSWPSFTLPKSQPKPTATPTPSSQTFSISAPLTDSIESENSVLVSGNSPSGSLVVIEGATDEIVVSANGDAKFAGKIALVEGKNDIVVTSYLSGKQEQQSVVVFYTPETF